MTLNWNITLENNAWLYHMAIQKGDWKCKGPILVWFKCISSYDEQQYFSQVMQYYCNDNPYYDKK